MAQRGRPPKTETLIRRHLGLDKKHSVPQSVPNDPGFIIPNYSGIEGYSTDKGIFFNLDQTTNAQEIQCGNGSFISVTNGSLDAIEYFPLIQGTTNLANDGVAFTTLLVPYIYFYNATTGAINLFSVGEDGLITLGGLSTIRDEINIDTGLKEVITLKGDLFGGGSVNEETSIIFRAGAGNGALSGNRRLAAVSGVIDKKETGSGTNDWEGGIIFNVFEGSTNPTPQQVIHLYSDKTTQFLGGIKTSDGSSGFTGTGAYTNFTIKNGIITAAS